MRSNIGNQAASELLAAFVELTDGRWSEAIILQVLAADDDNGNLLDGTPHIFDIVDSFADIHGWPNPLCPEGSAVKVAWEGPPLGVEPIKGTDYEVQDLVCPPIVTLRTTFKGPDPIETYFVGRTEADGSPGDLHTVTAQWAAPANQNIVVEVGMRPTEPCRSVSTIDIPAQSSSNYSSLRLNLLGPVNTKVACYAATTGAATGQGGRIRGDIAGNARAIAANAIGDGADAAGDLGVSGSLGGLSLIGKIPLGSTFKASGFDGIMFVTEELSGTLRIDGDVSGWLQVIPQSGKVTGNVLVGGNLTGTIPVQISGDMEGDFLVAGSIGVNHGGLVVQGVMRGKLCADDISHTQPLPPRVSIHCGIGHDGTICGQEPVCPPGNIVSSLAQPPHGTKDARQPYPMGQEGTPVPLGARQGIGSPNPDAREEDKIRMTLDNSGLRAISHGCWAMCETGVELVESGTPPLSANKISCVAESTVGGSEYEIRLERPISAGHWTTVRYAPGTTRDFYASLPGNISGDTRTNSIDLIRRIDCMNGQTSQCGSTVWTQDLDHSGEFAVGLDYGITFVDLWNGAGNFLPWQQTQLPANTCIGGSGGGGPICTTPDCGNDPGPMSMGMGGFGEGFEESSLEAESSEIVEDENAIFSEWVIGFLAGANPQDEQAEQILQESVGLIVEWCVAKLSADEKSALAGGLSDPGIIFASSVGQNAAAAVVEAIGH